MGLSKTEKAILNSWEIEKGFKQRAYRPSGGPKGKYCKNRGTHGKCKKYSKEEIFLYKLGKVQGMTTIDI